jgi:hypothetical protein
MKAMRTSRQLLLIVVLLALPAPALALEFWPNYNYAQISTANSTVDLVPTTSPSSDTVVLRGIKCVFPSNAGGASVKVEVTFGSGATNSITIDPTFLEHDHGGRYVSGWIPTALVGLQMHVQLNNSNLGTATINCWASWVHVGPIE